MSGPEKFSLSFSLCVCVIVCVYQSGEKSKVWSVIIHILISHPRHRPLLNSNSKEPSQQAPPLAKTQTQTSSPNFLEINYYLQPSFSFVTSLASAFFLDKNAPNQLSVSELIINPVLTTALPYVTKPSPPTFFTSVL